MTTYPIHTIDTAPGWAREPLARLREAFGFVPNAAAAMAGSPALLPAFIAAFGRFRAEGSFTPAERQVLLLTNAVTNSCAWAVAFHTGEALHDGVPAEAVDAIRAGRSPADPRLAALSGLARAMITRRGHLESGDTAGLDGREVLDAVVAVAISTMANYTASIAGTPVQEQFGAHAWHPEG
ncbi:carboxymuconolactone decarboxylase family protein [Dactylosporangium sp. CS-047395]|uniref:carboxymuconolactone decarboxylase family protein n=1 Tax=Dactylosporangium sp. CS-047395 TaxID=3239936 RepID=UPI003D900AB2